MKTIKISEATELQLDWLVAKCENVEELDGVLIWYDELDRLVPYSPSTDYAQGGPIIEREEIGVRRNAPCSDSRQWEASPSITAKGAGGKYGYGCTPLIAAMRCYVASKLGETAEVPEEL